MGGRDITPAILWAVVISTVISLCSSHGRLLDPPSRATMWRFGFKSPPDYDDNQGYCGGRQALWNTFGGKCGVCGDPYQPTPRAHERGGKYFSGTPTRIYTSGDVITARVSITANHRGWIEFRLCPYDKPKPGDLELNPAGEFVEVTQECLDRYLLETMDGSTRYHLPAPYNTREYTVQLKLPRGVACKKCLMQWKWNAANDWGTDPNGTSCVGCGKQEQFYACADVVIKPDGVRHKRPREQPTRNKGRRDKSKLGNKTKRGRKHSRRKLKPTITTLVSKPTTTATTATTSTTTATTTTTTTIAPKSSLGEFTLNPFSFIFPSIHNMTKLIFSKSNEKTKDNFNNNSNTNHHHPPPPPPPHHHHQHQLERIPLFLDHPLQKPLTILDRENFVKYKSKPKNSLDKEMSLAGPFVSVEKAKQKTDLEKRKRNRRKYKTRKRSGYKSWKWINRFKNLFTKSKIHLSNKVQFIENFSIPSLFQENEKGAVEFGTYLSNPKKTTNKKNKEPIFDKSRSGSDVYSDVIDYAKIYRRNADNQLIGDLVTSWLAKTTKQDGGRCDE